MPEKNRKILIDTNFLLLPSQHKIDIFSEFKRICDFNYSLFILDKTIDELDNIRENSRKNDVISANIAKEIINTKRINILKTNDGEVDELILECAKKNDMIVATLDKELKKRLKLENIKVITLRKSRYLIIV